MAESGRRTSARIKAEPVKRKFSDAVEDATPSKPSKIAKTAKTTKTVKHAPPKAPPRSPSVDEPPKLVLPTKLTDGTPLPLLSKPQPSDLKDSEWQSISDSGVFAASLVRARQAIARGTLFEKFWTKPTPSKKQKDMTEEEKLQLKVAKGPTQSKVGEVKLICEPLTFTVMLYMVKDTTSGHKMGQLPPDKQHLIYGGSPRVMTPQNAPYRPPQPQPQPQPQAQPQFVAPPLPPPPPPRPVAPIMPSPSSFQSTLPKAAAPVARPSPVQAARPGPPPPTQAAKPGPPPPTQTAKPGPPLPTQTAKPPAPQSTKPSSTSRSGAPPNPQAPDPVIHALAQRASANAELKATMKIVATGRASQQQLQYFQRHIDELTEMVKQKQEAEARARGPTIPLVTPASVTRPVSTPVVTPQPPIQQLPPTKLQASPQVPPQPVAHAPRVSQPAPRQLHTQRPLIPPNRNAAPLLHQFPVSQAAKPVPIQQPPRAAPTYYQPPAPAAPRPKMVTTVPPLHVVIAFPENQNERFLFPKYSILEFQDNLTTVVCSFIVLKTKVDKQFWTPVTITITGDAPSLGVLGRVVEPADVVRRYMEDVMIKHERAEDEYLAFRLPKDGVVVEQT